MRFGIALLVAVRRRHHRRVVRRGQRRDGVADRHRRRRSRWRNMMTGEVIFGGVGSGLYGMLLFVLLGVFLAGLMVGRTPEYLGKKIEAREIKLVALGTLAVPLIVLVHDRGGDRDQVRQGVDLRRRPAGLLRDALRLHLAGQQQRLRVRRLHRLRAARTAPTPAPYGITFANLLGGLAMLARPLPADAARARGRRRARRQAGRPRRPGHDAHRHADVRRRCSSRSC